MKRTRTILIVIAWIWILLIGVYTIDFFFDSPIHSIGNVIGFLAGVGALLIPSYILFKVAKKIWKKLERAERKEMMDSFKGD